MTVTTLDTSVSPLPGSQGGTGVNNGSNLITADRNFNTAYLNVKNLVIGGNFDTNPWQAGTTFNAIPDGHNNFIADNFVWDQSAHASGANVNITKTADAPTIAQAGFAVTNCMKIACATSTTLSNASESYVLRYHMEGYDWAQIAGQSFTISFWVKATVTGTYSIVCSNAATDCLYVTTYTVNTTNTWEKKVVTIGTAGSPAAGTQNYTNGTGQYIIFAIALGTSWQGTELNSWVTDFFKYGATGQVNGMSSNTNIWEIALLQVEPGTIGNNFARRSVADELALCQRYYEKSYTQGVNPATNTALGTFQGAFNSAAVAGSFDFGVRFKTAKRVAPTMTLYSVAGTSGKVTEQDSTEITGTAANVGDSGFRVTGTNGAANYGAAGHFVADARMT